MDTTNPDLINTAKGGVAMESKLHPGFTNYLRYYYIENHSTELNKQFEKTIFSLDGIGTVTKVPVKLLDDIVHSDNYLNFCGPGMTSKYLFNSAGIKKVSEYNVLFILSGIENQYFTLHSVITFNVELNKQKKQKYLTIDAFCSYQKQDANDRGVDNPGGRMLMDVLNRACKKMKIKKINLEALSQAKSWYKKKGFDVDSSKSNSDFLSKKISFSPELEDAIINPTPIATGKKTGKKTKPNLQQLHQQIYLRSMRKKSRKLAKIHSSKTTNATSNTTTTTTTTTTTKTKSKKLKKVPWWQRLFSRKVTKPK